MLYRSFKGGLAIPYGKKYVFKCTLLNRKCCRWRQTLVTLRKNWMSSEDSEENLETLQEYIDWCFDVIVMKKNQMHVLPPKARRRLPKEVARQTRLKQHRRRGKALPTSWIQSTSGCPASTRGCPWSRSCTVNLNPWGNHWNSASSSGNTRCWNASLRDSVKSLTKNVTHLSEENKK